MEANINIENKDINILIDIDEPTEVIYKLEQMVKQEEKKEHENYIMELKADHDNENNDKDKEDENEELEAERKKAAARQKQKEYMKAWYDSHKVYHLNRMKEQVECKCGRMVTRGKLSRHQNTLIHYKCLVLKEERC